jgi:hypothetical protein
MTIPPFTHAGYAAFLAEFAALGYCSASFLNFDPTARHLLLRHDIDMSIEAALPIAEIEREAGFFSYFFILLGSELYNPFSRRSRTSLRQLLTHGHKIGLHFDIAAYPDQPDRLDTLAAEECVHLEDITGNPVEIISFHRPIVDLLNNQAQFGGRPHTYMPSFFSEIGYCSDSRGSWRHGSPLEHEAVRAGRALQWLTHPIWWGGEKDLLPEQKLEFFLQNRCDLLDRELAENCETWRNFRERG